MKKIYSLAALSALIITLGFSCARFGPRQPSPSPSAPTPAPAVPEAVLPPSTVTGDVDIQPGITEADRQYLQETGATTPTQEINPDTLLPQRKR